MGRPKVSRILSLSLISRSLAAPGKIASLYFGWFQGKIIQSEGSVKYLLITSIIMSLEPIITFVKPGQNKVTEKNGHGQRIWIRLSILKLNQIGGHTEETFLRGEETFLSGEDTLLIDEEALLSGEETFLRAEETLFLGEETLFLGEETFLSGEDGLSRGGETFRSGDKKGERQKNGKNVRQPGCTPRSSTVSRK